MKKVLIVDDSPLSRKVVKETLSSLEGITLLDAEDGVKAIDIFQEQEIDLVILDLIMPNKDGFDVLSYLNEADKIQKLPVIVHSSIDGIDSISKAFEMGAYDYFTKPLTTQQMQSILPMKVRNALQSYQRQKTIEAINERLNMERLLANVFQQSLISSGKEFPQAEMHGKYVPSYDIGGVFYDCTQIGDSLWFIMAEVSDYGMAAAMLSSMIKMEFNDCIKKLTLPDMVLRHMNSVFYGITQGNYTFSAFVGVLEGDILRYSNGGHPFPIICGLADQDAVFVAERDSVLGLSQDDSYGLYTIQIKTGDFLAVFNNGLLASKMAGTEREAYDDLLKCFLSYKEEMIKRPPEFIDMLFKLFGQVDYKDVRDDMSLMLIHLK